MKNWRAALAMGIMAYLPACGNAKDGAPAAQRNGAAVEPSSSGAFCDDVGPPCGLTVIFEPRGLAIGTYSFQITTSSGITSCDFAVEPERLQTAAEAEAEDAMLVDCAAQGTCPPGPCTGPSTVYVRSDGLTIVEESNDVSILVENLATGNVAEQSFAPDYADHPARTHECHACRVATASMAPPQ